MPRTSLAVAFATSLLPATTHADGAFFPSTATASAAAASTDQRALFVYANGATTLVLQTGYRGTASGFSWVIPTPQRLTAADVSVAEVPVFERLHAITAPTLVAFEQGCGAFGCADDTVSSAGHETVVRVFDSFKVSGYEIAVLGAADSAGLGGWLSRNGYGAPADAGTVFTDYTSRGFYFVAVKYTGAAEDPTTTGAGNDSTAFADGAARPLQLRLLGTVTTLPLLISSLSTASEVDLVLYTVAATRYTVRDAATAEMMVTEAFPGGDFTAWYDARFAQAVTELGAGAFLVEFAAELDEYELAAALGREPEAAAPASVRWFVTRLHARLGPEAMTADLALVPEEGEAASRRHQIRVLHGGAPEVAARVPWDLTLVVALGLLAKRRGRARTLERRR
ncbi:MAG: DUF2330 domain-containing protein [Deltaproteobacteria bacterium]|nr:DUF2330 domain-containing protein [Deltaproteobacteria bacterium]